MRGSVGGIPGFRCQASCFGSRVPDFGVVVSGFGIRVSVSSLGFRVAISPVFPHTAARVLGFRYGIRDSGIWSESRFRISGFRFTCCSTYGCMDSVFEIRVSVSGFGIQVSGFGSTCFSAYGCMESGFGIRDSGFGYRFWISGFRFRGSDLLAVPHTAAGIA